MEKIMNIERELYINKISSLLQNEQIKVITGVRRCGKSYLLGTIVNALISQGIDKNHIIYMSMEDMDNIKYRDSQTCHEYIVGKIVDSDKYYILIDEVQLIHNWEQVVNSLRLRNTSIVITGSNSTILSGELATLLAGRYVEFQLRTISFSEYYNSLLKIRDHVDMRESMEYYIKHGGYPIVLASNLNDTQTESIVSDIYNSTILKDVIVRNNVKDEVMMNKLINYLLDNVGNLVSLRKISDYINSNGEKTNPTTIGNYVRALEKAYAIEKVSRYDIKGKELLSSIDKYYIADHSLMYVRKGFSIEYIGQIMENIVYNDLKRRGYRVYVGKLGDKEVDFVAEKQNSKIYVQVCYSIAQNSTLQRETESLLAIADNYNKYIVTMDSLAKGNKDGIEFVYLPQFLLMENL